MIRKRTESVWRTVMFRMIGYLSKPGTLLASIPKYHGTLHYTSFQTYCEYTCKVGDKVSLKRPGIQAKMKRKKDGPFLVTHVCDNGTVRIREGVVSQTVNIRRVDPYYEPEPIVEADAVTQD